MVSKLIDNRSIEEGDLLSKMKNEESNEHIQNSIKNIETFIIESYTEGALYTTPLLQIECDVSDILACNQEKYLTHKLKDILKKLYFDKINGLKNSESTNKIAEFLQFANLHNNFNELSSLVFASYEKSTLCFDAIRNLKALANHLLHKEFISEDNLLKDIFCNLVNEMNSVKRNEQQLLAKLQEMQNIYDITISCGLDPIFFNIYINNSLGFWNDHLIIKENDDIEVFLNQVLSVLNIEKQILSQIGFGFYQDRSQSSIINHFFEYNRQNITRIFSVLMSKKKYEFINELICLLESIEKQEVIHTFFKEKKRQECSELGNLTDIVSFLDKTEELLHKINFRKNFTSEIKLQFYNILNNEKVISPSNFSKLIDSQIKKGGRWETMKGYWELLRLVHSKETFFDALYESFFKRVIGKVRLQEDFEIFNNLIKEYGEETMKKFKGFLVDLYKSYMFNKYDMNNADTEMEIEKGENSYNHEVYMEMEELQEKVLEILYQEQTDALPASQYNLKILDKMCWPYTSPIDETVNFDQIKEPFASIIAKCKKEFKKINHLADLCFQSESNICDIEFCGKGDQTVLLRCNLLQAMLLHSFNDHDKWDAMNLAYYLKIDVNTLSKTIDSFNSIEKVFELEQGVLRINLEKLSEKKMIDFTDYTKIDDWKENKVKSVVMVTQNKEEIIKTKKKAIKAFIARQAKVSKEITISDLTSKLSMYLKVELSHDDYSDLLEQLINSSIVKRDPSRTNVVLYSG